MAVVLGFSTEAVTLRLRECQLACRYILAKMLIKSLIAGTVSAGEVKCSFSFDFLFYFRVPYCLNLRCILTNFAQFKVLCRRSMRRGTNRAWLFLFCYTFYARPDQEPHTRSECYPVFIILFFLLCFSSLFFFFNLFSTFLPAPTSALAPPLPPTTTSRPQGILRSDWVIRRLLLCSSDVIYLVPWSHPVIMTRHSYLLCALYLYMTRLLLLSFFCSTVLLLDLSSILFFLCHICN